MARARLAEDANDPVLALRELVQLASVAPDLPGLQGRLLEQAIGAGDLPMARSAAARLWETGDRRFDAQLVLIADAVKRSDWRAARSFAAGRADKAGGDVFARLIGPTLNGWIDVGLREKLPEQHVLNANGGRSPQSALAFEAALMQLATGRTRDAVELADATTPTDRTSQLVALRLVATLAKAGEKAAAERLRGRIALAVGERSDPVVLLPDQAITSPRAGIAQWFALLGDGFARTPNADPNISLVFARVGQWTNLDDWQVRTGLVEALVHSKQHDAALKALDIGRKPLPPVLMMRRAELLAESQTTQPAALELAKQAVSGDDVPRSLLLSFAEVARKAGDKEATDLAYRRIGDGLGNSEGERSLKANLMVARAELLLEANDWDAAEPLLTQALALRPDDPEVLNFVGYSSIERRKDVDRSLEMIEMAWRKQPDSAAITDSLGWAYFLTGKLDKAVPLLERAQLGDPGNAVIVEHLGDAYWAAGRKFQARYNWRAAALIAEGAMTGRLEAKLRDGLTPATTAP